MTRILLVEDDPDVRMMMEHVLIDAGCTVDSTGTMQGGYQLLGYRSYDLVIADGKLPDGTGLDVADKAGEKGTRALVITGYAFTLPGNSTSQYEILLKPLKPRELIEAVERALGDCNIGERWSG
jgi:two-component system response regulator HydG